ncbi:acyl-CoA dehydrogenase family protein [Pseudorhodoferax sp. Leaf267]|uniref:acyl-CoA dehydrogenase family protein n=1 Tax=Pseudorhodoferax sp. Leaf267 TaxID=1736316 RepID=UPI0006F1FF40|nr:acyl-CoA dehydrogenase family protein [Pseudorhodoferax sp. Leaf267]KQP20610.1 pimeloyl-CoA dehydrogenase small subunit [Pseudorhodoferax sp. Leaf267]
MNFEHTEDRRMLADTLNRYVAEQYGIEARHKIVKAPKGYSTEQWQQFAELGAIGALFSEADGGYGGAGFDIAVVFEALGRGLVVEPLLGSAVLAGSAIAKAGNEAQRAHLEKIIDGSTIAAFAHGEPGSGYTLDQAATTATQTSDGWLLNGTKTMVQQGEAATLFVVSASTTQGLSLFLVPADATGVSVNGSPTVDGGRVAQVTLTNVTVPADALLGTEGKALATVEHAVARGIVALAAESLGTMDVARAATLEYLQTRKQFGVPIGSFQALQHRMADVLLEIEQARSAVINAAAAVDGDDRIAREKAVSAAKYSVGRIGTLVAEEAIQLHGGIGMTWELPLSHYAKRLVMIDHQLGDEDFHLQRYIALGKEAA